MELVVSQWSPSGRRVSRQPIHGQVINMVTRPSKIAANLNSRETKIVARASSRLPRNKVFLSSMLQNLNERSDLDNLKMIVSKSEKKLQRNLFNLFWQTVENSKISVISRPQINYFLWLLFLIQLLIQIGVRFKTNAEVLELRAETDQHKQNRFRKISINVFSRKPFF